MMIALGIGAGILVLVVGIICLVIRRRRRIADGLPVFRLRRNEEGSHWY
jgi:hypothetical protein